MLSGEYRSPFGLHTCFTNCERPSFNSSGLRDRRLPFTQAASDDITHQLPLATKARNMQSHSMCSCRYTIIPTFCFVYAKHFFTHLSIYLSRLITGFGGIFIFGVFRLFRGWQCPTFPGMYAVASFERQRSSAWWAFWWLRSRRALLNCLSLVSLQYDITYYTVKLAKIIIIFFAILVSWGVVEVLTPPPPPSPPPPGVEKERSSCLHPLPPWLERYLLTLRREKAALQNTLYFESINHQMQIYIRY